MPFNVIVREYFPGFDHEDGSCRLCANGIGVSLVSKKGHRYFRCSNPKCDNWELDRSWMGWDFIDGDEYLRMWAEAMLSDKDWS